MNPILKRVIDKQPKENTTYIEGDIAVETLEKLPETLSIIFEEYSKCIDSKIFRYLGYEYATPEEELMEDAYTGSANKLREIHKSTVYMVKFIFEFKGEKIYKYMFMPYAERGGIIEMSGTPYYIIPVITDVVISAETNKLLVRLNKDRISISSISFPIMLSTLTENNEIYDNVIDLDLLLGKPMMPSAKKLRAGQQTKYLYPMIFSIYYKYGFHKTIDMLSRFNNENFKIFVDNEEHTLYKDYVKQGYRVYSSSYIGKATRPKLVERDIAYVPHTIKIATNLEDLTFIETNIITSIIHICDVVNDGMCIAWINCINENKPYQIDKNNNECLSFINILSKYIYETDVSLAKKTQDTIELMENFEGYVDSIIKNRLTVSDISVNDFFELTIHILKEYINMTTNVMNYSMSVKNSYFEIMYYLACDVINKYHMLIKKLSQEINSKDTITVKEVKSMFNKQLTIKEMYKLVKSSARSLATIPYDTHGDCIYFKGTSMLELQSCGNGAKCGGNTTFPNEAKILNAMDALSGSILNFPKKRPSPKFRYNFYCQIDDHGVIVVPDHLLPVLEECNLTLSNHKEIPENLFNDIESMENNDDDEEF